MDAEVFLYFCYEDRRKQEIYIAMSLKDQINGDIKKAMLAKQKDRLPALRAIKSLILLAETDSAADGELSEEKGMEILLKAAKQRRDSAAIYEEQNRPELKETELLELSIIEAYLPSQLSDDELKELVQAIVDKADISSPKEMGKVMGPAMAQLKGKADGKRISDMVKALIS